MTEIEQHQVVDGHSNIQSDENLTSTKRVSEKGKKSRVLPWLAFVLSVFAIGLTVFVSLQLESQMKAVTVMSNDFAAIQHNVSKQLDTLKSTANATDKQVLNQFQAQISTLQQSVNASIQQLTIQQTTLSTELQALSSKMAKPQAKLDQQLALINKQAIFNSLQLAKNVWQVTQNKKLALFFIQQAENYADRSASFSALNDDSFQQIKAQLNSSQDRQNLLKKLNQLAITSTQLSLLSPVIKEEKKDHPTTNHQSSDLGFKQRLVNGLAALKGLVSVQKITQTDVALSSTQTRLKIQQNLSIALSTLKIAVLENDADLMKSSIKELQKLVEQYYENNDVRQQWIELLQSIQPIDTKKTILMINNLTQQLIQSPKITTNVPVSTVS